MKLMQTPLPILFLLTICVFGATAEAARVENIYTAEVPIAAGPKGLQAAFAVALDQVLVKSTGRSDIVQDLSVRKRFGNSDRFVQQYRNQPDGKVWVRFDEVALRRELDSLGVPVWGAERPNTLVWMVMDYGLGQLEFVVQSPEDSEIADPFSRDAPEALTPAGVQEALQVAADLRGLPIIWPLLDIQEKISVSASDVWNGFTESLVGPSRRYEPDAILIGRGRVVSATQTEVRWTLLLDEERFDWTSDVARGANELAEFFASRMATSSASAQSIFIRVDGVASLNDYGRLSDYLTKLDLVEHYGVEQVAGQQFIFKLQIRGDADRLMRSIALQRVLQPVADPLSRTGNNRGGNDASIANLHYRLNAGP